MRVERERKKKLIVAFHFQFSNQAGWDCGSCRKHGLETKRRCGFLPGNKVAEPRVVWGRKKAFCEECPKSFITGESIALVEEFFVRRRLSVPASMETEARKLDAFLILQDEMENEDRDGTSQH